MVCFYPPQKTAIGPCIHCQRGLCVDCAAIVEDTLVCKNRHEEQVRVAEQMKLRNMLQSKRVGSGYIRNAIFYVLVGLLFVGFAVLQFRFLGLQAVFFMLIGAFLIYAAVTNYFEGRKYR